MERIENVDGGEKKHNVKCISNQYEEDDLHNRFPVNLYCNWGREVTFQVTS